jgi:hypothetical protein
MKNLWKSKSIEEWQTALATYENVIAGQGVKRLPELDTWYQNVLPRTIAKRRPRNVTLSELVKVTEWKMSRGVWRARNLALVRGNEAAAVVQASQQALELVPHPTGPIKRLAELDGVGPATASAVMAAAEPGLYPFFDDLVAQQMPQLDKVAYTLTYYARYADLIRERAIQLGGDWSPVLVEQAMWASVGGKAGNAA